MIEELKALQEKEDEKIAGNRTQAQESVNNLHDGHQIYHHFRKNNHHIKPTTTLSPVLTNKQVSYSLPDHDLYFHFSDAIAFLKRQGSSIGKTNVSCCSSILSAFLNCNRDPVSESIYIVVL